MADPGNSIPCFVVTLEKFLPSRNPAIAIAAYAKASGADGLIAKVFEGRMMMMITN